MLVSILQTSWPSAVEQIIPQDARELASSLFNEYLFAFEVVGVLLLAAVIGGLYLAHKAPDMPSTNNAGGPGIEEGDGI
jgi:NADH:ubiquinone oxidoreductase subunit 6 (subunit J)